MEEEKSIDVSLNDLTPPKGRLNNSFMTPSKGQLEISSPRGNTSFSGCSLFDKSVDSQISLHDVISKNFSDKNMISKLEQIKDTDYNQVLGLLLQTLNDIIEYDPIVLTSQKEPLSKQIGVIDLSI